MNAHLLYLLIGLLISLVVSEDSTINSIQRRMKHERTMRHQNRLRKIVLDASDAGESRRSKQLYHAPLPNQKEVQPSIPDGDEEIGAMESIEVVNHSRNSDKEEQHHQEDASDLMLEEKDKNAPLREMMEEEEEEVELEEKESLFLEIQNARGSAEVLTSGEAQNDIAVLKGGLAGAEKPELQEVGMLMKIKESSEQASEEFLEITTSLRSGSAVVLEAIKKDELVVSLRKRAQETFTLLEERANKLPFWILVGIASVFHLLILLVIYWTCVIGRDNEEHSSVWTCLGLREKSAKGHEFEY